MNITAMAFKDVPQELRHLHPEATHLICNDCGRENFGTVNENCGMLQPSGNICSGVMVGLNQQQIVEFRKKLLLKAK